MGPYSDGFRTELAARGYEPSSAAGQLQVMAHLSRWLVDRGLDGHGLTFGVVEEFLRARRVAGYRQWLSARGIAPLLDHLREVGIAPVCSPAMADSVVEVLLAGYRAYLIEERGLAASTVRNYVDVARQFVSQYGASGRTDLCGLTAAQVSEFVLAGCRTRGVGSAAILVVGMRALLRYLHLAGVTQTGWRVRCRRRHPGQQAVWRSRSIDCRRRGCCCPATAEPRWGAATLRCSRCCCGSGCGSARWRPWN